ncbi:MAG: transposase [Chloroflexi bacterium]|nr:MAG: transposase [Chloroflexota bacterium]
MTHTRYKFLPDDPSPYFITATTVNWLPFFSNPDIACILLESLQFLIEQQRLKLHAYVIMENHIHLIASSTILSKELASFKSYTARQSIDYYLAHKNKRALAQLSWSKPEYETDRDYKFWQDGVHPQRISSEKMMQQKIDYIHQNPVRRGYIDDPAHWRYSSARSYLGQEGLLPVVIGW